MKDFLDMLAHLDMITSWLRGSCFIIVGAVLAWRFMTDLSWPYFRLGVSAYFLLAAFTGFAIALGNDYVASIMRTLQTPILLWLALTSVHYVHRARRHRILMENIKQPDLPPPK